MWLSKTLFHVLVAAGSGRILDSYRRPEVARTLRGQGCHKRDLLRINCPLIDVAVALILTRSLFLRPSLYRSVSPMMGDWQPLSATTLTSVDLTGGCRMPNLVRSSSLVKAVNLILPCPSDF